MVPSGFQTLFDPTKPTGFVGGADTKAYLPWQEAAKQESQNNISPLASFNANQSNSQNSQGASDMPSSSSYYQYGDLSPIMMPQVSTPSTPFTNQGTTTTGQSPLMIAKGGKVNSTAALFAAKGGDVPHKGSHYVQGAGGGQDDLIEARLADGEYVFDADIVAALGDGSNAEGARRLNEMREAIRAHKRSAPNDKIPPKAKSPLAYLRGIK